MLITALSAIVLIIICIVVHRTIPTVRVGGVTMDVGSFTTSGCSAQIIKRNREKILLVKEKHPRWSIAIYDSTGKRTYLYTEGDSV